MDGWMNCSSEEAEVKMSLEIEGERENYREREKKGGWGGLAFHATRNFSFDLVKRCWEEDMPSY